MFWWGSTDLSERIYCHFSCMWPGIVLKVAPPS
jgi:hypothetical protein